MKLFDFRVQETLFGEVPDTVRVVLGAELGVGRGFPTITVPPSWDLHPGETYVLFLNQSFRFPQTPGLPDINYAFGGGSQGIWTVVGDTMQPRSSTHLDAMSVDEARRRFASAP